MSGKRHDTHRRRRSVNKYQLLMATLNLPRRWSVSHVSSRTREGQRTFCTERMMRGRLLRCRKTVVVTCTDE